MSLLNTGAMYSFLSQINRTNNALNRNLLRMSTGLRINSAADDPAGLVASEFLRGNMAAVDAQIDNIERANSVVSTADGGLEEISSLLTQVKGLVVASASTGGLSEAEIQANQLQIDQAVASIQRIASTTSFNGQSLLDGSQAFRTTGLDTAAIENMSINAATIANAGQSVAVEVTAVAEQGMVTASSAGTGASAVTIEVAGNRGTATISLTASSSNATIAAAVNVETAGTGVSATASANGSIYFNSTEFGSSEFVSVEATSGTYATNGDSRDEGEDATVTVNGQSAAVSGLEVTYAAGSLDASFSLSESFGTSASTSSFSVTGGGAAFSIGGELVQIGINSVNPARLGASRYGYLTSLTSGGANDVTGASATQLANAEDIVDSAISQVSSMRGRLGGFQSMTLDPMSNSLTEALTQMTSAESDIRSLDFTAELASYTRNQIMLEAATGSLASLIGSQRSMSSMIMSLL